LSMKEVGDGLHEQMNCMMGALQELKLLQVQAALEQLDISGSRIPTPGTEWHPCCRGGRAMPVARRDRAPVEEPSPTEPNPHSWHRVAPVLPRRQSHACGPQGPGTSGGAQPNVPRLCRAPAGRFVPSHCAAGGRPPSRHPLLLWGPLRRGHLVGNWLDLPELDKKGEKSEASLPTSRSQELCRKFSLTANIFKKFLRSVRPDRDRLLKEKPCWLPPEDKQPEISKRSKKMNKLKGTFYFPLHGNIQNHHGKAERCSKAESNSEKPKIGTKKVHETIDCTQSGFDINTAVWV
ncbi:Protein FAM212B, partial [Apaloderma vittatum]